MDSLLVTFKGFGGIYVGLFLFAMLSGVFPLASSEAVLAYFGAFAHYEWSTLVVFAVIVALGQSTTHAMLFSSARGIANASAKKRAKLEARIAKARELGKRWEKSEVLLIALGATIGIPQVLIALLAGVIGIRFRTFVSIDVVGRIARFVTIVAIAHAAA